MSWTNEQAAIIAHGNGHAKVSAVAGSGKTSTLVERVARLLEQGQSAKRLQIVMFNTSAVNSFQAKLRQRLSGGHVKMPVIRTFHSMGMRLCQFLSREGHISNWTLESRDWVEARLASEALSLVNGEPAESDDVEMLLEFIGLVKSDIISASDKFPEAREITRKAMPESFVQAFTTFERLRQQKGIRFFSDLIYDPVSCLMNNAVLAHGISNRLDHLLIDEYQDINEIQQALVTLIAGSTASVMAVGDVDQCIYEWRGAKPEYMQTLFDADFSGAETYQLSYTFRYGHELSLIANHLIQHNAQRDGKLCLSHPGNPQTRVTLLKEADNHPAVGVIQQWQAANRSLNECAVLVRLYGMSVGIELALLKHHIPYRIDGRDNVFASREARALFGYLRLAGGRRHMCAVDGTPPQKFIEAMLAFPRIGLTNALIEHIASAMVASNAKMQEVANTLIKRGDVKDWRAKKLFQRALLLDTVEALGSTAKSRDVLKIVWDTVGLDNAIARESRRRETAKDRQEACRAIRAFVDEETVTDGLSSLDALMQEAVNTTASPSQSAVTLTSIHRAKGLEWPLVIMPGLREGGLPVEELDNEKPIVESERRLCYVGMTRAKESLVLIHPEDTLLDAHLQNGIASGNVAGQSIASRFLYESNADVCAKIANELYRPTGAVIEAVDTEVANTYLTGLDRPIDLQAKAPPSLEGGLICGPKTPCRAEKGMRVRHRQFGSGIVTAIHPRRHANSIHVRFDTGSERVVISNRDVLSALL